MKIQKKTFLLFFACISVFVLAGILFNFLFLEKFYLYKTKQEFVVMSKEIQTKIETTGDDIEKYISKTGKKENIRILILDTAWNVQQMSYYQREDKSNIPLSKIKKMEKKRKQQPYICEIFELKNDTASKIIFLGKTKSNQYLVLMKNTNGVRESVAIANQFYLFIGGIMLFISIFLTALFSKKITRPIIKMCAITNEMEKLHFEHKIEVKSKDEVGELADSINHMAERLQEDIYTMQQDIVRRKQLVRDVSHELKSPIAVIKGYADGLQYGVADDKDSREKYCQIISNECDRMDQMVKDLLELSKLEQIVINPTKKNIHLYLFIKQLEEVYSNKMQEKGCKVTIHCNQSVIVEADEKMLEHIMTNLFGNAVKYVKNQGEIVVSVTEQDQGTRVEIYNTGDSIPNDDITKVWDVFYKVDKSRKREQDGHGIGLAIVKTAVELHHGTVFLENKGEGVSFGFFLPKTSH